MKKIAIFGAGGFGREVHWLIEEINAKNPVWEFIGFFDDGIGQAKNIPERYKLGTSSDLNDTQESISVVFALGDPRIKRKVINQITNARITYPVLIHPTVLTGNNVSIGEGSIICAGCILTVDISLGRHVILNLGCTVGHDTTIGDYSSFMPSVNISGEVDAGEAVYGGTGAKIINRISIGEETIIGAGAVVSKSLPPQCTAVGIPAKPVKFHN